MFYSYVEIEYVATSFSPARMDLALKLLNSTSSIEVRRHKVNDLQRLINDWEVQGRGLSEVGVNWEHLPIISKSGIVVQR